MEEVSISPALKQEMDEMFTPLPLRSELDEVAIPQSTTRAPPEHHQTTTTRAPPEHHQSTTTRPQPDQHH